ncbi:hypothetical protein N1031_18925 [Herbiconiux moechotypicola]|uniref:Uncharacterized protein n=1 Tax=Herbiconiux moechotypicola TaxID=637393 RepID=A0ABN3E4B8_9MICO|nr:hypothetical protein [Herbiconiux moechotypicola]MCS5731834.1 hypothetical protein [Herbiconiux moechotypicola]
MTRGAAPDPAGTIAQLVAAYRDGPVSIGRLRARIRQDRRLSAGYLGAGFAVLGGLLFVRGLASLAWSWSDEPARWLSVVAWASLLVAFAGVVLTARWSGGLLPGRVSVLVTAMGPGVVALDLAAFLLAGAGTAFYPTTTIGYGACLLACLPLQSLRRSVVAATGLAVSGTLAVVVGWLAEPASLSAGVTGLVLGLTPVVACLALIHGADRSLGRKIEQAVTESLVTAPALGHGVTAVSELRRIDGDAERLLATVARLPASAPIPGGVARDAQRVSEELRFALIADHEQSWLQIAVTESDHLRRTVRVIDPGVLAAGLDPRRRKDLLALTWLCVDQATAPALDLTLLPAASAAGTQASAGAALTIVFSLTGTHRRGIDAAVWPLFARLGRHTVDLSADRALVVVEVE